MLYAKLSIKQREIEIRDLKSFFWEASKQENNYDNLKGLDKRIDSFANFYYE